MNKKERKNPSNKMLAIPTDSTFIFLGGGVLAIINCFTCRALVNIKKGGREENQFAKLENVRMSKKF